MIVKICRANSNTPCINKVDTGHRDVHTGTSIAHTNNIQKRSSSSRLSRHPVTTHDTDRAVFDATARMGLFKWRMNIRQIKRKKMIVNFKTKSHYFSIYESNVSIKCTAADFH